MIMEKARENEKLLEDIADITTQTDMARTSSPVDLAGRYKWAISNKIVDVVKELGLIRIQNI